MGFEVGKKLVMRCSRKQGRLNDDLEVSYFFGDCCTNNELIPIAVAASVFAPQIVKFICKDFWNHMFKKQVCLAVAQKQPLFLLIASRGVHK